MQVRAACSHPRGWDVKAAAAFQCHLCASLHCRELELLCLVSLFSTLTATMKKHRISYSKKGAVALTELCESAGPCTEGMLSWCKLLPCILAPATHTVACFRSTGPRLRHFRIQNCMSVVSKRAGNLRKITTSQLPAWVSDCSPPNSESTAGLQRPACSAAPPRLRPNMAPPCLSCRHQDGGGGARGGLRRPAEPAEGEGPPEERGARPCRGGAASCRAATQHLPLYSPTGAVEGRRAAAVPGVLLLPARPPQPAGAARLPRHRLQPRGGRAGTSGREGPPAAAGPCGRESPPWCCWALRSPFPSSFPQLVSALHSLTRHVVFRGLTGAEDILALFPENFHQNLKNLLTKIILENVWVLSTCSLLVVGNVKHRCAFWYVGISSQARISTPRGLSRGFRDGRAPNSHHAKLLSSRVQLYRGTVWQVGIKQWRRFHRWGMIWLFSTQGTSASVLLRHCAGEHRTVAEQLLWVPIQLSAW